MSWSWLLPILFYIGGWIICGVMLYLVPRKRDPDSATAWLLFAVLLPYIAAIAYAVLSSPKLPPARLQQQREMDAVLAERVTESMTNPQLADVTTPTLAPHQQPIAALVQRLGGMSVLDGNDIELLTDYEATIQRIADDIDQAQHYVHILYYIFADDKCGRTVADALARAVARGVSCRVLHDSIGNLPYAGDIVMRLKTAGVRVHAMLPLKLTGPERRRPDLRNHRKIAVIDGTIGYTGSQNLTIAEFKPGVVYEELVARVRGPVVVQLAVVFLTDWYAETGARLPQNELPDLRKHLPPPGDVPCQVLPSGPAYDTDNVSQLFATLLFAAKRRAILVTPYFIPDAALLHAIENAALRGVDVHLIVSAKGDQFVVSRAQRSYYEEMLAAGVHIHAVRAPTFVHAKHLSIDDDISVVGSSNFDIRSFQLDLEIVLVSYSASVVKAQKAIYASYIKRADEINLEQWRNRSRRQQFIENTCRLVSGVL